MHLSLVIPTYNEKENLPILLERVFSALRKAKIQGEVIIVDDNSPDGTGALADSLRKKYPDLRVIHRKGKLGLSSAVLEGFAIAKGDVLGVMDADLSHPPESIPAMLEKVREGADIAIGSRYVKGGGIEGWSAYRKLQSRIAVLLAKPLTAAKDPMSGFFLVRKACIEGRRLDPKGFKILLEILMKADAKAAEVPITFVDRKMGKSKLDSGEVFSYIWKLMRNLPSSKSGRQFLKFAMVGFIGTMLNLTVLFIFTEFLGLFYMLSAAIAFMAAASSNFILNKVFTFGEKLGHRTGRKFGKFLVVSAIALCVNLAFLFIFTEYFSIYYLLSEIMAILIAMWVNFIGNKRWTFRSSP